MAVNRRKFMEPPLKKFLIDALKGTSKGILHIFRLFTQGLVPVEKRVIIRDLYLVKLTGLSLLHRCGFDEVLHALYKVKFPL